MTERLCIHCLHFRCAGQPVAAALQIHKCGLRWTVSPVDGVTLVEIPAEGAKYCHNRRMDKSDACGPEGKLWEAHYQN